MPQQPSCDLLKIHYLCGDKDNVLSKYTSKIEVVICSKFITFAVTKTTPRVEHAHHHKLWFAQNSLPLRWQRQPSLRLHCNDSVVICSKFITFAVTKTTHDIGIWLHGALWFAQNSLPLRWQRQREAVFYIKRVSCDLLKIHYLCGDKDNWRPYRCWVTHVVICSKFITFAVTKTTHTIASNVCKWLWFAQNSLPLRWQRQPSVNVSFFRSVVICSKFITFAVTKTTFTSCQSWQRLLWFAQNSLPLRWQRQQELEIMVSVVCCDLLKIHYLCGDKDNNILKLSMVQTVVICSKFITFAVTKTTVRYGTRSHGSCDLLKIHYLCGDKDNFKMKFIFGDLLWFAQNSLPLRWQRQRSISATTTRQVVICSKFITFAVTKTTKLRYRQWQLGLWFAQNSLPLRWQRQLWSENRRQVGSCDLLKIHYLCGDKDNP